MAINMADWMSVESRKRLYTKKNWIQKKWTRDAKIYLLNRFASEFSGDAGASLFVRTLLWVVFIFTLYKQINNIGKSIKD